MSQALHRYLKTKIDFPDSAYETIQPWLTTKNISKGEQLVRVGEICKHVYFVSRGCLRSYVIDDKGKEHIIQFAPENWWISEQISAFYKEPSMYFIDSVEDSEVLELDGDFFEKLQLVVPAAATLSRRLQLNSLRSFQKRLVSHLSATGDQRYLSFLKTYPEMALRLPQKMIASYLGVTPESLSRIRKDLAT